MWYAIFYSGAGKAPERVHGSVESAIAAFVRWAESIDNAGSRSKAGNCRITGPYRTRREAAMPDVNDPVVRNLEGCG